MSRIYTKNSRSAFSGSDNVREVFNSDININGSLSVNGGSITPSCSTFFTPITYNWKSVSSAIEVPSGSHVYGQMNGGPVQQPKVIYTVPSGRCALILSMSQDGVNGPDARASYAVRDNSNTYYLVGARGEGNHHERFIYMVEGDSLVVWGLPGITFNVAASFIEFDKKLPDGCFYQIIRLSTTLSADEITYTIPDNHSAILCPNLLPIGEEGEEASESIILGRDGVGANVDFEITNTIDTIDFTEQVSISDDNPFNTSDNRPRLTSFKGGDIFKLSVTNNSESSLATITTALFVKPDIIT